MVKLLIPWLINLKLTGDVDAFLNANNVCRFYTYAYCQGSFLCVWKKCILEWGSDNGPLKMLKCESKEKRNGPILNKNSQILCYLEIILSDHQINSQLMTFDLEIL